VITADVTQLEELEALLQRRADHMVSDAEREGKQDAEAFAAAGGRSHARQMKVSQHYATGRRLRRRWHATAVMVARMTEHAMYQKLHDFFGTW